MFTQEITPRRHSLRKVHIIRKLRKNGDHSRGAQTGTHKLTAVGVCFRGEQARQPGWGLDDSREASYPVCARLLSCTRGVRISASQGGLTWTHVYTHVCNYTRYVHLHVTCVVTECLAHLEQIWLYNFYLLVSLCKNGITCWRRG